MRVDKEHFNHDGSVGGACGDRSLQGLVPWQSRLAALNDDSASHPDDLHDGRDIRPWRLTKQRGDAIGDRCCGYASTTLWPSIGQRYQGECARAEQGVEAADLTQTAPLGVGSRLATCSLPSLVQWCARALCVGDGLGGGCDASAAERHDVPHQAWIGQCFVSAHIAHLLYAKDTFLCTR